MSGLITALIDWPGAMAEIDIPELIGSKGSITDCGSHFEVVVTDAKPHHRMGQPGRIELILERSNTQEAHQLTPPGTN